MNSKVFLKAVCTICFLTGLFFSCASANAQDELNGRWWDNNVMTAKGYGAPPKKIKEAQRARALARRAAIVDGYRQLAEQVHGVHITAETTVESLMLSGDIVRSSVDAVIKGATVLSEEYDKHNNCTVVMAVPIFGGMDSIAQVAIKPVDKEDFPTPTKEIQSQGHYTGLIIDCGDSDVKPVLLPSIRNADNRSIYSYNNLDYDKVVSNGMVTYAMNDSERRLSLPLYSASAVGNLPLSYDVQIKNALLLVTSRSTANVSRAGDNPLIIKASSMSDNNSCPVVSDEDADRILAENQASHFLDSGSVVFTSYRVGGLRA